MKSDDIAILGIPEIKAISPSATSRDQVINTTPENRASSSSSNSSGGSPSDLRRRLQDLPSPDEFTLLADRVAALNRRICRKREFFLRLHGVAGRIEENDEWEEREQRDGSKSSLGVFRLKDARARRRARIRLESSSCDDKTMVISQPDGSTGSSAVTNDDGRSNPIESSVDRSARDCDYLRLPAIEVPRRQQSRSSSEPSTTRLSLFHNNGGLSDIGSNAPFRSYRNFTPRDDVSKSADARSVSPFAFSNVRPKKFGGYRPPSGIVLKNLSSGSESESANEASRELSSARKIDSSTATLELSSPESKVAAVSEPIKKMPIMSARSDITRSILPSLLPSTRSLCEDDRDRRAYRNTPESCAEDIQENHDGSAAKSSDEPRKISDDVRSACSKQLNQDKLLINTFDEFRHVESEYKDTRDEKEEMSENTLTFPTRGFISESVEIVTNPRNERILASRDEPVIKIRNKQIESESKSTHNEKEGIESCRPYPIMIPEVHCDDIEDRRFDFNCPTNDTPRKNLEDMISEKANEDTTLSIADREMNAYTGEAVDTSHLIERIQNDAMEDDLSSQISEMFGSEYHSQSSCTSKVHLQKEMLFQKEALSTVGLQNDDTDVSDKCDREITTNVPTLALNSQDISYSTSAGSRECSAMRHLDPHALIKALSDVSLKQRKEGRRVSSKHEDFSHQGKSTIDISSRASNFPARGETWRVSTSLMSEPTAKSLPRVPSRIPVRISSSKTISSTSANKLSEKSYCKNSENAETNKMTNYNYEEAQFIDRSDIPCEVREGIIYRRPEANSSHSQTCVQNYLPRSTNGDIEVTIIKAHSGMFTPEDGIAGYETNDCESGNLSSSNLQSSQSTPLGDHIYRKIRHLSENRFSGENYPPTFLNEATYSGGNRNFLKIDDDVRSDRYTSRKSAETTDITSATESPYRPKYKDKLISNKQSSRVESSRNAKNIIWKMEDECASINDEENIKIKAKEDIYHRLYKSEDLRLPKEHFKSAIEGKYDLFPLKILPPQACLPSEIEKIDEKQRLDDDLEFHDDESNFDGNLETKKIARSESLIFRMHKAQKVSKSSFATRMSLSTLNLNCESKRKKKSQERFPFTILEAPEVFPTKHKDSDSHLSDKNLDRTKVDNQLEEKTVHQLKVHPSIMRLATAGLEDTVTEILCCVAQDQKEEESSSKSRMKGFLRIFSSKSRRNRKQRNNARILEPAKIIYENSACRVNSKANSSSGGSSMEETHRTNLDKSSNSHWIDRNVTRSRSMFVSDGNTLKKTDSLAAIPPQHLPRQHDRDDLWVRDLEEPSFELEKNSETSRKDQADSSKESPPKDRYSIFLAKSFHSDKLSELNVDHGNSLKGQQSDLPISDHEIPSVGKDKKDFVPEEAEEDLTGCLCLRLCRFVAPSKYPLSIRKEVSSSRSKKSSSRLWKRKK